MLNNCSRRQHTIYLHIEIDCFISIIIIRVIEISFFHYFTIMTISYYICLMTMQSLFLPDLCGNPNRNAQPCIQACGTYIHIDLYVKGSYVCETRSLLISSFVISSFLCTLKLILKFWWFFVEVNLPCKCVFWKR